MLRLRMVGIVIIGLLVLVGPARADESTTVFPESGRYSLEVPTDWAISTQPANEYQNFIGESITVAPDKATLQALLDGNAIGDGLTVTMIPIAQQLMYVNSRPLDELSLRDQLNIGLYGSNEVETFTIGDLQAAKTQLETGLMPFANLPYTGVTAVLDGGFVYRIHYGSGSNEGLAQLEAIATTFTPHPTTEPQLNPSTLTQRQALTIDDTVTLPLAPDWLVMYSPYAYSTITSREGYIGFEAGESSMPKQYIILPDQQAEFLEGYYAGMANGLAPLDAITGLVLEVTAYPYDSKLGHGDVQATTSQREMIFKHIIQSITLNNPDDITSRLINGVPVLSVDINSSVVGTDTKRFHLVMVDVNYKFYVLAFAAPEDQWLEKYATLVDALDAGINVNSFSSLAAGIPIGVQNGQQAPEFEGTLVDGTAFKLSDYRGKVVLLNFWASWCEPCVDEMPTLIELAENEPDLVILSVNFEEDKSTVDNFVAEYLLPFAVAYDIQGEINALYEIYAYPTNIIIDDEGIIYGRTDPTSIESNVHLALRHAQNR